MERGVLNGESRVEGVSPKMFPKGCNKWLISYVEWKRSPDSWCIMAERVGEFLNFVMKRGI